MKKNALSNREKEIMELLWNTETGLTSIEMLELLDSSEWNKMSVLRTINGLLEKECIKVTGFEQYNTQYARRFTYALTQEELAARFLQADGLDLHSLSNIAMAMIKNDDSTKKSKEDLIDSLQEIIDNLKKETQDSKN